MKETENPVRPEDAIDYGTLHELTGYWLRRAQLNTFKHVRHHFFDEFEMTPGLFGVLEIVGCNPGLTQTAVAQAVGNDRSAMVAILDKLQRRGLIERKPAQNDRRSNALFLTEQGQLFRDQIAQRALEHNDEFFSVLTPEEHQQLVGLLKRVAMERG